MITHVIQFSSSFCLIFEILRHAEIALKRLNKVRSPVMNFNGSTFTKSSLYNNDVILNEHIDL